MTEQEIKSLTCKKHIKIYLLKRAGLTNKQVADALGTNSGHVYNALKNYKEKPELVTEAEKLSNLTHNP